MQEFSSISVSSYEAGSLAERLTEQSADGWAVEAIVQTGSSVTAYLSRAVDSHTDGHDLDDNADHGDDRDAPATATTSGAMLVGDDAAELATDTAGDDAATLSGTSDDAPGDATDDTAAAPIIPESTDTGLHAGAVTPDPVDESPGWAASTATDDADPVTDPITSTSTFGTSTGSDTAVTGATDATETAATDTTATDTTATDTAAAGAAPAGWYADPSSRFELRYWDGTQWTEHVSRSGQQYTDPPVA